MRGRLPPGAREQGDVGRMRAKPVIRRCAVGSTEPADYGLRLIRPRNAARGQVSGMSGANANSNGPLARSQARLAAVQGLYQMDLAGTDLAEVIDEFKAHRIG